MYELNEYQKIGTVSECRKAMNYYNQHHKARHGKNENCKTCKIHGNCDAEKYSSWCIYYKNKTLVEM